MCPRANRISCFLLSKHEFPLKSTENTVTPARLMALSRKRKNTFYISERQDSSLHPSILFESYESFHQNVGIYVIERILKLIKILCIPKTENLINYVTF